MKTFWCIGSLLLLLITTGCKKEGGEKPEQEVQARFPPPGWKGDESGRYPATMTAVVALPATLRSDMSDADQLAAFVGEECRGVGVSDNVGAEKLYFILVRGMADEQSKVSFKYYNARTGYLYQSGPEVNFLVDAVWGTAANPKVLALNAVR